MFKFSIVLLVFTIVLASGFYILAKKYGKDCYGNGLDECNPVYCQVRAEGPICTDLEIGGPPPQCHYYDFCRPRF